MRFLAFASILLVITIYGCFPYHYVDYKTQYTEVDREKAKELIKSFKDDVLIFQIPTPNKKITLLKNAADAEEDEAKRAKLINEIGDEFEEIENYIDAVVTGAKDYYKFSKYFFLPDTTINNLDIGSEIDKVLDSNMHWIPYEFTISESTLVIQPYKQIDRLIIGNIDNKLPNQPFPYTTGGMSDKVFKIFLTNIFEREYLNKSDDFHRIRSSISAADRRLNSFYNKSI